MQALIWHYHMELSDFYQSTIILVRAYFGFSDFSCNPDEITTALGIEPDEVIVKGSKRTLRNGRITENLSNSWSICSRNASKDVNVHIRELFQRFAGKEEAIRKDFGNPSFSVLWKGNYLYAGSGPFYEADVIKGIATLGANLWQDIYQVDQSDDEIEYKNQFRRIPK
jgi:hypothetical protein